MKVKINTKITNFPITKAWKAGKKSIKEGKRNEARDYFDSGIVMVATLSDLANDYSDEFIIEGKPRSLWLMRFWKVGLQNNDLLL
jgi:hypothetical protein